MCDVVGCHGIPYAEVYKFENHTWSYLCKKHYEEEYIIHGNKYGWYELTKRERLIAIFDSIKLWWTER